MANRLVLRGNIKIKSTLPSGAGDELLTRDAASAEVGKVPGGITSLTNGYIYVGNVSNLPVGVLPSGDLTLTNLGNFQITAGAIINVDINAAAAIALTKLAAQTASRAAQFNASGFLEPSAILNTELAFLSGATSNIQVQINGKQVTITGAATTITTANLTGNLAVISNSGGKIATSVTTSTELGYLSGVTSLIQPQIDSKLTVALTAPADGDILIRSGGVFVNLAAGSSGQVLAISGGGLPAWSVGSSNGIPAGGTLNQVLRKNSGTNYDAGWGTLVLSNITDVSALAADVNLLGGLNAFGVTFTNLSHLLGSTSNLQVQIGNKLDDSLAYNAIFVGDAANRPTQLAAGSNGEVLTVVGGALVWQVPSPPGSVSGVAPSTDNAIVRWNGLLGNSIQNSGIIISDSDAVTGVVSLTTINQGGLILSELTANGVNTVTLKAAPLMAANYNVIFPAAAPATDTYLKYNGTDYVWGVAGGAADVFASNPTLVLPAGFTFGKYDNGDTPTWVGLTAVQAILDALIAYINPVFTSFSITGQATTEEVGITLTGSKPFVWGITVNSGVVPTMDIYNNTTATTLIAGTANDGAHSQVITTIQLNTNGATQSWKGIGNNTSPAGTFNSSNFVVTARFYRFFGAVTTSPTTSANVRALPSSAFHTGATTFILNTGSTLTKFSVCLPPGVTITSVIDITALGATITGDYVLIGTVNVTDAGGTTRAYNKYEMNIGAPYTVNHEHSITTAS